jgi:hypothetical protein
MSVKAVLHKLLPSVFLVEHTLQKDKKHLFVFSLQSYLDGLPFPPLKHQVEMLAKGPSIFRNHKMGQLSINKSAALDRQEPGRNEVGFLDDAEFIQGEVADGSKIIEVAVTATGFFQDFLSLAQFIVLHLQLDLSSILFLPKSGKSTSTS